VQREPPWGAGGGPRYVDDGHAGPSGEYRDHDDDRDDDQNRGGPDQDSPQPVTRRPGYGAPFCAASSGGRRSVARGLLTRDRGGGEPRVPRGGRPRGPWIRRTTRLAVSPGTAHHVLPAESKDASNGVPRRAYGTVSSSQRPAPGGRAYAVKATGPARTDGARPPKDKRQSGRRGPTRRDPRPRCRLIRAPHSDLTK
jgi:hypothetical protein